MERTVNKCYAVNFLFESMDMMWLYSNIMHVFLFIVTKHSLALALNNF
jgi:hypothetical protein